MTRKPLLPKGAKRVFRGKIFTIYQWPQRMYDGTRETFEMLTRPDTVEVIAVVGNRIVLQFQRQPHRPEGFLSLPGGRVDPGETPLAAAKRELLEETGYASRDWCVWKRLQPAFKIVWTDHFFIARDCRRIAEPHLDAGEKIKLTLIALDEFLRLADNPRFRSRLVIPSLYRMRLYPKEKAKFQRLLFKK